MFGSEQTDLVVKYYDDAFGISADAEINWYLNKAITYGGPVLDLACGTGRLALRLAQNGFDVTAMDQSEGMLSQFKTKLLIQPAEIKERIHIIKQKMADFRLESKYGTILCCDAFFHNLTVQEQLDCLTLIRQQLAPEGRFVFNLPNPNIDFILSCRESNGEKYSERGRYPIKDSGDTLLVEQANSIDVSQQTVYTHLRLTRFDPQGHELEKGESTWTARYLYPIEAVHLLYRSGFEVEALVGDYQNGPVAENSQLIFQAR